MRKDRQFSVVYGSIVAYAGYYCIGLQGLEMTFRDRPIYELHFKQKVNESAHVEIGECYVTVLLFGMGLARSPDFGRLVLDGLFFG